MSPGPRRRLSRPAIEVAPELLGAIVRHTTPEGSVAVRLTEVEAYMGADDPGSHAYRGPTKRNAVMFGEAGHLYCYRHLGLHHCVNVVCGPVGVASAVLLRAGEVVEGRDLAYARRTARGVARRDADLARGPARLTVALGLDLAHNGVDLVSGAAVSLELPERAASLDRISTGPRVGVSGDGGDGDRHPWRFWLTGEPTVSDYRRA